MISNEKWKEIGEKLSRYFVNEKFKSGNDVIHVQRQKESESKTVRAVFINGTICLAFANEKHADFKPISHQVWKKKVVRLYSKQKLELAKKQLGVRLFNEMYPKDQRDKQHHYWFPYFSSSKTLIAQFKKIEGIEYLEGDEQCAV